MNEPTNSAALASGDLRAYADVCSEIRQIMQTYREQEERGYVDTPGGLEHMSDVWRLLSEWDERLAAAPSAALVPAALSPPGAVGRENELRLEWRDGPPPKPWSGEWFIALTVYGDRVVLTALPEEYTYDFRTADDTYIKAENIKRWMQFPDSEYVAPDVAVSRPAAPVSPATDGEAIHEGGLFSQRQHAIEEYADLIARGKTHEYALCITVRKAVLLEQQNTDRLANSDRAEDIVISVMRLLTGHQPRYINIWRGDNPTSERAVAWETVKALMTATAVDDVDAVPDAPATDGEFERLRQRVLKFLGPNFKAEAIRCDDGLWMIATLGDTLCLGDPNHQEPDDQERFEAITDLLNWVVSDRAALLAHRPAAMVPDSLRALSIIDQIVEIVQLHRQGDIAAHNGSSSAKKREIYGARADLGNTLLGRINDLRARIAAEDVGSPVAGEGWRPMETAPKDGTHILVWDADVGEHEICWWSRAHRRFLTNAEYSSDASLPVGITEYGLIEFTTVSPMAWMPLFAPPADSAEG